MKGKIIGILAVLVIALAAFFIGRYVEQNVPGNTWAKLSDYYAVKEGQALVFRNQIAEEKMVTLLDGEPFLPYEEAQVYLKRLYQDIPTEQIIYTTPTKIYMMKADETAYTLNEQPAESEKPFIRTLNGEYYVSFEFISLFYDWDVTLYEDPDRLMIYDETATYQYVTVEKETQLRVRDNIKSEILMDLAAGQKLYLAEEPADEEEEKKKKDKNAFLCVMTEDGISGYVQQKQLADGGEAASEERTFSHPTDQELYTSVDLGEPVIMVWHQVFNETANSYLEDQLTGVSGVNVISPTWFSVIETNGKLSTLADHDYVEKAHALGLQVWPSITDFETSVNFSTLFASEAYRRNLINNIFWFIYKYDLDGINIDFERVTPNNAADYTQFLRELSLACRNENLVLSIDNYVPTAYTAYYDREEEGILADYVMVMAYDEHYSGSEEAGSVSSLDWVRNGVRALSELVEGRKIVAGLPFYTRVWYETKNADGSVSLSSEAMSETAAANRVAAAGVEPTWDGATGQYYAEWTSENTTAKVWLEEERSLATKLEVLDPTQIGGLAFWKLGLERDGVWDVIADWKGN